MNTKISQLVQDVVSSPLGDVIASVGEGVAQAQQSLDEAALAKTLDIYSEGGEEALKVLRDIGYRPTFYALPETTGEVNVALSLGNAAHNTVAAATARNVSAPSNVNVQLSRLGLNTPAIKPKLYATPVDGGYSNRYGFSSSISAKLTFKIVPVPAPDGADELRVLPNFVSKTVEQARNVAEQLGLNLEFVDAQGAVLAAPDDALTVASQTPAFSDEAPVVIRMDDEIQVMVNVPLPVPDEG